MRPKKLILWVSDNAQELSVIRFLLATNGYRVLSASTGLDALEIFAAHQVDLALVDFNVQPLPGTSLMQRLKTVAAHVPIILLGDPAIVGAGPHVADAFLAKKQCTPLDLLDRIRIMAAKKRGPRKGAGSAPKRPPSAEAAGLSPPLAATG